jgi:hypothetical protein
VTLAVPQNALGMKLHPLAIMFGIVTDIGLSVISLLGLPFLVSAQTIHIYMNGR